MKDLFGVEIVETRRPKAKSVAKGFAAPPGTGPAGETCRTCANVRRSGRFFKCALVKPTHGLGSDIRLRWDACRLWQPTPPDQP